MTAPARLRSPRRGTGSATGAGSPVSAGAVRAPATSAAAPAFALPGVQRKMAVGKADSTWEREADGVADKVMQGAPAPAISALPAGGLGATAQRKEGKGDSKVEETDKVQAKAGQEEGMEDDAVQKKEALKEDEVDESVQKKDADKEEEVDDAVQKKDAGREEEVDDAVQKKDAGEEEEEPVQARASGREAHERPAAEAALRHPGPGAALPGEQRSKIERSTGADLSDVRVHDDASAARAAEGIGARAFTHGRDIWLGPGESARDTALMAHEAAHVVQQTGRHAPSGRGAAGPAPTQTTAGTSAAMAGGGGAPPRLVQREENDNAGDPPGTGGTPGHGTFPGSGGTLVVPASGKSSMTIDEIKLPGFAKKQSSITTPADLRSTKDKRENAQIEDWVKGVKTPAENVRQKFAGVTPPAIEGQNAQDPVYFMKQKGKAQRPLVGTAQQIGENASLPTWDETGKAFTYQVDHVNELQLGGTDRDVDNLQLIDRKSNIQSSNMIRDEALTSIGTLFLDVQARKPGPPAGSSLANLYSAGGRGNAKAVGIKLWETNSALERVTFQTKSGTASGALGGPPADYKILERTDVEQGKHLEALEPITDTARISALLGGNGPNLQLFYAGQVQTPTTIRVKDGVPAPTLDDFGALKAMSRGGGSVKAAWDPGTGILGGMSFELFGPNHKLLHPADVVLPASTIGSSKFAYTFPGNILQQVKGARIRLKAFSPIQVTSAHFGPDGINILGDVKFTSKALEKASAQISISSEGVFLQKTFTGRDFVLPGPVQITESALTLGIGVSGGDLGASITGKLDFEVDRVGKGYVEGKGQLGAGQGFSVGGEFEFDPDLFHGADAKIRLGYANDKFTGEGTLKIGEGQFKGIKSAELMVKVEDDKWEAAGTVEPKIPGVSQGTMSMKFDPAGGFEIAGELTLGEGIPRLKSGKLNARLSKEGEAWKVAASGEAELDIPGVASKLAASYDDGKFKAEVTAAYARGIASGSVTVGATNMPVDPETGAFTEGEPAETITIFGSGTLSIQFTPWLKGTAGVVVKPDGKMEVKGKVELPSSLEVFPEKKLERELISIGVDIPVFGVAVAGQRIGIFLNIAGGLTAKASIGPGELKDVAVEVAFDPEDMSTAKVTGTARFVVPAKAGLRLTVQGAIGAGIPIVSARAGLELGAELGIAGEAYADAQVEWTPAKGLSLEADVGVKASPQFTFDVTGFVDVSADLVLTEIELYSKRWQLASFKYGSGMEVGANLKVKMENNEIKPITMDDVTITKPDIDPVALAKGVISQVV